MGSKTVLTYPKYNILTLQQKDYMGAQCVRSSPKLGASHQTQRIELLGNELRECQEDLHFTLTIQHLRLTNMTEKVKEIKFSLENEFTILYSLSQFSIQENIIKSERIHKTEFKIPANKVQSRKLKIQIIDFKGKVVQILNLKLHQLITGPLHHDHLLQQLKSRLMFDLNIYQTVTLTASCYNFKIKFPQQKLQFLENFAYRFILTTQSDEKTAISQLAILEHQNCFQSVAINLVFPHNYLKSSNFRFQIIKDHNSVSQSQIIKTFSIPYSKVLLQSQHSILKVQGYERHKRLLYYSQPLQNENNSEILEFQLQIINSNVYAEQMEGLFMSQIGVTTISPHTMVLQKQTTIILNQIEQAYKQLKKFRTSELTRDKKSDVFKKLDKILNKVKILKDQNYIDETDLYEKQIILLKLLNQFSKMFTQGQDFLNEKLWQIISVLIHRNDLSVKYFNLYKEQSMKKEVILKFYCFICLVLEKIIVSTNTGITFNQLLCIQKFIAFSYFRFPWVQTKILNVICDKNDPQISQEKLLQFGASLSCKSPSKSFVYDWEKNIYNFIKNQNDFKQILATLQDVSSRQNGWPQLLFNRKDDDLYYGLYFQLWEQAELSLKNYHGEIMWEFFPNYGMLLSSFLGEMNNSKISEFSISFKKCSNKLILNEKLLNTFVMLLFPKTSLYETSCVLKCLSFLQSYFQVLTRQHKKLPHDFNFNYFYTGIKSIFQQNHSYLIVKTLLILYKYYKIFTNDFKKTLNSYIFNNNIFVHLFLHWCSNVRKMFHHFLQFIIIKNLNDNNPEEFLEGKQNLIAKSSKSQAFNFTKKLNLFLNLLKETSLQIQKTQKQQNKHQNNHLYLKMKEKLKKKRQQNNFSKLYRQNSDCFTQNNSCLNFQSTLCREKSLAEWSDQISFLKHRKWSVNQEQELITQHLEQRYKKYAKIGLKQFQQVKKGQNPQKQIQKLGNMFQGQIDS